MTLPHRLAEYNSPEGALEYLEEYEKVHRKVSDKKERRLLDGFFERIGPVQRLLDLPCGWGRYLPWLSEKSERVLQAAWSASLLTMGRDMFGEDSAQGRFRSLGNQLPLADGAVDVAFSMRLNHHLIDPEVRRTHLREMLRVSGQYAVFSYFDHDSVKNRIRLVRQALGSKKRPKNTLRRSDVTELAAEQGFTILEDPRLFFLGSGHRLVLAKRDAPF